MQAVETQVRSGARDARPRGPSPRAAVALEVARAAGELALAPLRAALFLAARRSHARAFQADLASTAPVQDPGSLALGSRPLRIFLSCAEPSGEHHAARLVEALRVEAASAGAGEPEFLALGGERIRALGVRTLGDPLERAAMGADPLRSLPFYARLLTDAARCFSEWTPDLLLPVDSPALHVPLARLARRYGVPVVHLVAPQYWAWAPWRVRAYARAVDLALTILPFEPAWFARHGVKSAHVGHPELDSLPSPPPRAAEPPPLRLALLPGSRRSVIARNLPWMLACAARVRAALPGLEVAVLHGREELRPDLERALAASPDAAGIELALGDLSAELARSGAALSVSGTILIDLLVQRLPAAVVYRVSSPLVPRAARAFLTVPWFSSVDLLAQEPVYPESCFAGDGPLEETARFLERCFTDRALRARLCASLDRAAERLGPPGALRRAARHALAQAASRSRP